MEETKDNLDLQRYELMYIIPTVFDEDKIKEIIKDTSSQIKSAGGVIVKEEDLGHKKLAYRINQQHTGHYVLLEFDLARDKFAAIEKKLRLSDEILRFLITKITPKTEEDLAKEKEVAKRIEDKEKEKIVKEIEDIKEKDKEGEEKPAPEIKLPEDKKEDKRVSLEDLDKKLDEILDDDVNI